MQLGYLNNFVNVYCKTCVLGLCTHQPWMQWLLLQKCNRILIYPTAGKFGQDLGRSEHLFSILVCMSRPAAFGLYLQNFRTPLMHRQHIYAHILFTPTSICELDDRGFHLVSVFMLPFITSAMMASPGRGSLRQRSTPPEFWKDTDIVLYILLLYYIDL